MKTLWSLLQEADLVADRDQIPSDDLLVLLNGVPMGMVEAYKTGEEGWILQRDRVHLLRGALGYSMLSGRVTIMRASDLRGSEG